MGSASGRWAALLGVSLGGFFDGILLHQILQWHHLLSLVPGMADIRLQVLWDGYFHALMYVLAALALWGLWRAQRRGAAAGGASLAGALLAGFGLWHVVDALVSHWALGIHRIRVDVDDPLVWDLSWLVVFGLVPMALGWALIRRGPPRAGLSGSAFSLLLALAVGLGAWAMRPPPDEPFTAVVFRGDLAPDQVMRALEVADARLVSADAGLGVVMVAVAPEDRWRLYLGGALLVGGTGLPAGCLGWSRPASGAHATVARVGRF
ncbi:DUF2243 domain-containing protein [Phenylobacterium sp.]|uniref:DUF2243 domain-containing protein n=1 Tax=Phenylobacterium sp. TaxID=1871053 RepID=UPI002E361451|nr:DUF2243 domain-containing protein [Phenylobacterium sp.]HEX2560316.1 DUF2243 domain-containing protein [Phenylobacterium sp.]